MRKDETCDLSQEARQCGCSMGGEQRAGQGAGVQREGKRKPWFNLRVFEIHRHLRLEGKPKGNTKILTL